jgi:hypothetical protein
MNGVGRNTTSSAMSRDPYTMRSKAGSTSGGRDEYVVGRTTTSSGLSGDPYTMRSKTGSTSGSRDESGRYDPKLDLQNPTSIFRENLRLRVREDEKRLGDLIRPRGTDYYSSPADESKSNNERGGRDNTRAMMRGNGGSDSFLYDKLLEIEEGFASQARRIRALEGNLVDREDEINLLRGELVKKLEKQVQLELELKSMEPRAIDEDLLSLTGSQLYDIDLDGSIRGNDSLEVQRAKQMIAKLMADLRNLEQRYKEDQLNAARTIDELRLQNGELRENKTTMVVDLERRVREIEEECVRLGRSVEVKDRQIDNLKRELSTFRLNQMSGRGGAGDGQFSDFDRELLRSSPSAYERDAARTSSFRRNQDDDTPRRFDDGDRVSDRNRDEPSYRSRSSSPGRNIRFAENLDDEKPLSKTKESQLELIRQSRARSGSFDRSAGRDSNALTEDDIFPRGGERGRSGFTEASARRSDTRRVVRQDQEQAIQRAKSNGLFGRASRRLFGRA